jgi:hypothetical protein
LVSKVSGRHGAGSQREEEQVSKVVVFMNLILEQTFGFEREMAADGFVSLTRPDVGFNVIYLRTGLPTFRPRDRAAAPPMACSSC